MKSLEYNVDLVLHLVKRSFYLRYKGSAIGILWYLLLPLSQLLVLVFLFGKIVPLKIDAYPAFVFSALLPWVWFSSCLNSASSLFISNRDLIRKPNFVPFILIIVDTLSNLLAYIIFLPILFIMLAFYGHYVSLSLLYFPLLIMIQSILLIGLGMIISTMNVFYRDIQQIVHVAVMLLFYLTPIFYRSEAISSNYTLLFYLNPVAVLIQGYRSIIFYGSPPEWGSLLLSGAISVILCTIGFLIYKRRLPDIFDAL
ncbi:MAG: ABC transporter permease [Thermodesulfovibrionales bacterium]|nr:ABC transporter permease [Thermodesulfovibrionales bacterium]